MNVNKIVMGAIGIMVAVVMVAGAFLPAVFSAVDNQATLINNTYSTRYSSLYVDDVNADISIESFTSREITVTVGDITYSVIATQNSRNALIYSDQISLIYTPSSGDHSLMVYNSDTEITDLTAPINVSVRSKQITVTDSSTEPRIYTATAKEWVFIPDTINGNYEFVLQGATDIYLNSIEQVYFSTIINTDSKGFVSGQGDLCTFYKTNTSYSVSFLDYDTVDKYTDVIEVTMQNYRIDSAAGTNTNGTEFIPFTSMVPRSIDGHTEQNAIISSLFNIMPIIAVAGLVMSGIYVFINRK